MNIIRFSDLCAQGKAQGQRVFIRADLNVPLNDAGEITEDMMINFFHSLVENPDRKVFRMRFDTSHRNHSFRISIENAEGDIFCETNQKLFWNAVH